MDVRKDVLFNPRELFMKNMFFLITFFSYPVFAETLTDRIHSVVKSSPDSHIVRFEKGRVGFISSDLFEDLKDSSGTEVQVELDQSSNIRSFDVVRDATSQESVVFLKNFENPPVFEPTVITSSQMNQIYKSMNQNFKRISECSDRAHVWAWDEFKKSGTKSQKAFIFFTASYINRVRFKWWFHVAPMFDVGGQKMIADVMYKDRPITVKEWSDMMVFSKRDCKMTTKFSEYDVNPQTEDCYMMFDSMYYRLPGDLNGQEVRGTYRSDWNESEVNGARSRAFNVGRIQ